VGWEIEVDEESFRRFQSVPGPFGEELRRSIVTEPDGPHPYALTDGERCPFLREDGLCRQILELGEESLCEICANHPRFFERYGDIEEQGVGLACEEAARLLFTAPAFPALLEEGEGDGPDGNAGALFPLLSQWREACFAAAADESMGIYQRLEGVLVLGRQADAVLWGEQEKGSPTEVLPGHALLWLDRLEALEPIDEEWTAALADAAAAAEYPELLEEFALDAEERQYDRLLYYLLYRYALRSVWDGEPRRWSDFAVFGVLTVELLDFGRWLKNGQRFTPRDRQDMARIFSKEIEYDPELLEGLTEIFDRFPPFQAE
jgi:lysine-N-methylase